MTITVIIRSAGNEESRLTFDGTQRIVIGRGAGSDVRLPDTTVSHRHATLRAQGAEFVLVDEGSTNGTFVGAVRVAPHTSRLVRSGDTVHIGRLRLELRLEQAPVTRDMPLATHDLALAILSQALEMAGEDMRMRVRVVEGVDQGKAVPFLREKNEYTVGREPRCELCLSDLDVSREHLRISRRNGATFVFDLGAKNGTWMGGNRIEPMQQVAWRPSHMLKVGRTVLALEDPLNDALARIENSPDEPLPPAELLAAPAPDVDAKPSSASPRPNGPPSASRSSHRPRWSIADIAVMTAAVSVLILSLAGLAWLLKG